LRTNIGLSPTFGFDRGEYGPHLGSPILGCQVTKVSAEVAEVARELGNVDFVRQRFKKSGEGKHDWTQVKISGKCRYGRKEGLIGNQNSIIVD
jgi:hypothetical protein